MRCLDRLKFACTIFLLLASNTAQAIDDCTPYIGKFFWVTGYSRNLVDRMDGEARVKIFPNGDALNFKVTRCIEHDSRMQIYVPTAEVGLPDASISYLDSFRLSYQKPNINTSNCEIPDKDQYVFTYNPLESEQKCKDAKAAQLTEKFKKYLDMFMVNKIIPGTKVWVQIPIVLNDGSYLPAFTQAVFKGISTSYDDNAEIIGIKLLCNGVEIEPTQYAVKLARSLTSSNMDAVYKKKWNLKTIKAIKERKIVLGMSKEQVTMAWGEPQAIHKTTVKWGTHEQWVYRSNGQYVYFENGKMTSYQD